MLRRFTVLGTCVLATLAPRVGSAQHITIDGRLSPAQTLVGPNYTIGANLGKQVGSNLFHSFGQFNLSNTPFPESAVFTPTGSTGPINNVISRVTGGNQSSIDGAIVSAIPGANFYLINPSGIVFGPHATLNVSGSFHASTADYVKMSDGAKFQATNPDGSTLSAAAPAAFGFMNPSPPAITVNGSTLGVTQGQTLGLVGGGTPASPTLITGATLSAPAGTIHVTSVAGTGEVPLEPRNAGALTVTSFGPASITAGATLNVSDPKNLGSGGSVFIRSGALTIDASEINADNYGSTSGGAAAITAGSLNLSNGGKISASTFGSGNGGNIVVNIANLLTIDGTLGQGQATGIYSNANAATGNAGNVTISAGCISLLNGGAIVSDSFAFGNTGSVRVNAAGAFRIDGTEGGFTGIALQNFAAKGSAGSVTISAGSLSISNNGEIKSSTFGAGTTGAGAGNVTISAGSLSVSNNGEITSSTSGPGAAGDVSVTVGGALSIDGGVLTSGAPGSSAISSQANAGSAGNAGNVTVSAGSLTISNNGLISGTTFGLGRGGDVSVSVGGALSVDRTLGSSTQFTGITSEAAVGSTGNAGNVTIRAGNLSVSNNGEIRSDTFALGDGGDVSVTVAGALSIEGGCQEDPGLHRRPILEAGATPAT
jgi:filamentous hemagglutinin family protein